MYGQLKSLLQQEVTIYPCIALEEGQKVFGDPFTLQGLFYPEYDIQIVKERERYTSKTQIFFDEEAFDKINKHDEIEIKDVGRFPIQHYMKYKAIQQGYDYLKVVI